MLNVIVSPLILGQPFFLVVAPIGVTMRLFGKDFLGLRRSAASYWLERDFTQAGLTSLTNQF